MTSIVAAFAADARPLAADLTARYASSFAPSPECAPEPWGAPGVALLGRRGATTPEAEREPFPVVDAAGDLTLAWDGRLDNRAALAGRLGFAAREAGERADGEYALAAYRRWGEAALLRLVGDWAFVLWDARARRLTAARSPLGWRPLYYRSEHGSQGRSLVVASDLQQLVTARGAPPRIDREYVLRYLADAGPAPGATAYEGVREVEGGQLLVADEGGLSVRRFWDAPTAQDRRSGDPLEYVEEFESLVAEATRAQLRASGRVGVLLSGGLDSSYVAAVAARLGGDPLAISSYAPGTAWDERAHQQAVIVHTGLAHHTFDVSEAWALNPAYAGDAAFDSPAVPAQHALLVATGRAAADAGTPVVLSGIGGDEWLTGDRDFLADALLRRGPRHALRLARRAGRPSTASRRLLRAAYQGFVPPSTRATLRRLRGASDWNGLFPLVDVPRDWRGTEARAAMPLWPRNAARRRQFQIHRELTSATIGWSDRHAHRPYGVEVRSPLNDLRVVEFLARVPEWVKRFDGRPKAILRAALMRAGIPASIYDRRDKASYDEPYDRGLCDLERDRVESALDAVCALPGVRAGPARAEAEAWLRARNARWEPTWRLVSTGMWLHYVDNVASQHV